MPTQFYFSKRGINALLEHTDELAKGELQIVLTSYPELKKLPVATVAAVFRAGAVFGARVMKEAHSGY